MKWLSLIPLLWIIYYILISPILDAWLYNRKINKKIDETMLNRSKDEWNPGADLPWDIVIMCERIEDFSIEQIIRGIEAKAIDPEAELIAVIDDIANNTTAYVPSPIITDHYGFPGQACNCITCSNRRKGIDEATTREWMNHSRWG